MMVTPHATDIYGSPPGTRYRTNMITRSSNAYHQDAWHGGKSIGFAGYPGRKGTHLLSVPLRHSSAIEHGNASSVGSARIARAYRIYNTANGEAWRKAKKRRILETPSYSMPPVGIEYPINDESYETDAIDLKSFEGFHDFGHTGEGYCC